MSFNPNMSKEEVAALDRERGKKFYDPLDHYDKNTLPKLKKPWLIKTPVNKSGENNMSAIDILKTFIEKGCSPDDDLETLMKMDEDSEEEGDDVKKALNSKSMHIPRPNGVYDPFDITRSATTPNTRAFSKLRGPDGVAPLIGDTLRTAEDDANVRSKQTTYKSCGFHRLVHRESTGCTMCSSSLRKSDSCESCGEMMEKVKGGDRLACKECG